METTGAAPRAPNMVKHVCVAARIGEGKAPGEDNSYSYCQDEQRGVAWRAEQVPSVVCLDATPERDMERTESTRFTHTYAVASPRAGPLLHAAVRRRFWLQPFGLARVLAHSPRLSAKGFCRWGGDGDQEAQLRSVDPGTVPANGPAANESRRLSVESLLLRMTKPRDFLLALSQNRDSASRVSPC